MYEVITDKNRKIQKLELSERKTLIHAEKVEKDLTEAKGMLEKTKNEYQGHLRTSLATENARLKLCNPALLMHYK